MEIVIAVLASAFVLVVLSSFVVSVIVLYKRVKRLEARLTEIEANAYVEPPQEEKARVDIEAEAATQKIFDRLSMGMSEMLGYNLETARRSLNGNETETNA